MNYELAKKLKDAGFPDSYGWIEKSYGFIDRDHGTIIPTLSELIAACGSKFLSLNRVESEDPDHYAKKYFGGVAWCASASDDNFTTKDCADFRTPEEAVANLWLQLNQK